MKFAVISDMHVGPERPYKGVVRILSQHSEGLVNEFVDKMNSDVQPKFAIQLGDAIGDSEYEISKNNYETVVKSLTRLDCPAYHVIGNHDQKNLSEEDLRNLTGHKKLHYSFDAEGYHFVVLFSKDLGSVIRIDDVQVDWLKEDLDKTNKKTLIFVHHSLADQDLTGNFWFEGKPERCFIENRAEIRKLLKTTGKVLAVINGHLHWNRMVVHDSVPYFTVQSLVEDIKNDGNPSGSYTVVELNRRSIHLEIFGNDPQGFTCRF